MMSEQPFDRDLHQGRQQRAGGFPFVALLQPLARQFRNWQRQKAIADLNRLDQDLTTGIGIPRADIPRAVDRMLQNGKAAGGR